MTLASPVPEVDNSENLSSPHRENEPTGHHHPSAQAIVDPLTAPTDSGHLVIPMDGIGMEEEYFTEESPPIHVPCAAGC